MFLRLNDLRTSLYLQSCVLDSHLDLMRSEIKALHACDEIDLPKTKKKTIIIGVRVHGGIYKGFPTG